MSSSQLCARLLLHLDPPNRPALLLAHEAPLLHHQHLLPQHCAERRDNLVAKPPLMLTAQHSLSLKLNAQESEAARKPDRIYWILYAGILNSNLFSIGSLPFGYSLLSIVLS